MRLFVVSRHTLFTCAALSLLTLVALQGCSDDDDNPVDPGPAPTQLTGVFANTVVNGMMTITIQGGTLAPAHRAGSVVEKAVQASAILTPDLGATATLTGTYEADTLNVSGDGYLLHGVYESATSALVGFYSGPNGFGNFICGVGGPEDADGYCGTFLAEGISYSGAWNLVIVGSQVHVVMATAPPYTFSGTVTGTGATRTIEVDQVETGFVGLVAEGTLDTGTNLLTGTFDLGPGDMSGTWSAGPCGGTTSELVGTFVGKDDGGRMTLSIDHAFLARVKPAASMAAHSVRALGVFTRDEPIIQQSGLTFSIAGSYNPETDSLALIGQGYGWEGAYDETTPIPAILGQYHPTTSGYFACAVGDTHTVKVFCGRFENGDQTVSGHWNFMMVGAQLMGMAVSAEGDALRFEGSATGAGTTRVLDLSGHDGAGGVLTATGTLDLAGLTISNGTWQTELDSGTWGGATCPAPAPPPGRNIPWEPAQQGSDW